MRTIAELQDAEVPPAEAPWNPVAVPAASTDITTLLSVGPSGVFKGRCFITVVNPTAGALVIGFGKSAATDVNGYSIPAGLSKRWLFEPKIHKFVKASAVGLTMYISSYDTVDTQMP